MWRAVRPPFCRTATITTTSILRMAGFSAICLQHNTTDTGALSSIRISNSQTMTYSCIWFYSADNLQCHRISANQITVDASYYIILPQRANININTKWAWPQWAWHSGEERCSFVTRAFSDRVLVKCKAMTPNILLQGNIPINSNRYWIR